MLAEFPATIQREYDIRNSAVASPKREILIRLIGQRCSALCLQNTIGTLYTWLSQLDLLPAPGTKAIGCDILRGLNIRRPLGSRRTLQLAPNLLLLVSDIPCISPFGISASLEQSELFVRQDLDFAGQLVRGLGIRAWLEHDSVAAFGYYLKFCLRAFR